MVLAGLALGYWIWLERQERQLPEGIAVSTGILTATQVPVASATGGTVLDLLVQPGAALTAGTPVVRLKTAAGEATVSTPRAGRLDRILVVPGAEVEPGRVVATLTDLADLTMIAPFPLDAAVAIPIGAEARIQFTAFRDAPVSARVISVAQPDGGAVDRNAGGDRQQGRTATVMVEVTDTRSLPLEAGQRGRVYVRLREGAPWPARIR